MDKLDLMETTESMDGMVLTESRECLETRDHEDVLGPRVFKESRVTTT